MESFQENLSVLSGSKPRPTVPQVIVKRINAVPSLVGTPVFLSNARWKLEQQQQQQQQQDPSKSKQM